MSFLHAGNAGLHYFCNDLRIHEVYSHTVEINLYKAHGNKITM